MTPAKCKAVAEPDGEQKRGGEVAPRAEHAEAHDDRHHGDERLEKELRALALADLAPQGAEAVVVDEERRARERGTDQAEQQDLGVGGRGAGGPRGSAACVGDAGGEDRGRRAHHDDGEHRRGCLEPLKREPQQRPRGDPREHAEADERARRGADRGAGARGGEDADRDAHRLERATGRRTHSSGRGRT